MAVAEKMLTADSVNCRFLLWSFFEPSFSDHEKRRFHFSVCIFTASFNPGVCVQRSNPTFKDTDTDYYHMLLHVSLISIIGSVYWL